MEIPLKNIGRFQKFGGNTSLNRLLFHGRSDGRSVGRSVGRSGNFFLSTLRPSGLQTRATRRAPSLRSEKKRNIFALKQKKSQLIQKLLDDVTKKVLKNDRKIYFHVCQHNSERSKGALRVARVYNQMGRSVLKKKLPDRPTDLPSDRP